MQKLSEYSIIEIVEKICDPDRLEGEWIAKQDIVEEGTKLKVSGCFYRLRILVIQLFANLLSKFIMPSS